MTYALNEIHARRFILNLCMSALDTVELQSKLNATAATGMAGYNARRTFETTVHNHCRAYYKAIAGFPPPKTAWSLSQLHQMGDVEALMQALSSEHAVWSTLLHQQAFNWVIPYSQLITLITDTLRGHVPPAVAR